MKTSGAAFRRTLVATAAVGVTALLAMVVWVALPLPSSLLTPDAAQGLTLTDRHGLELRVVRSADGSLAGWMPLEEMDAALLLAFIATEDRRFQQHLGIDPRAVVRAGRDNLQAGRIVSGASTITMQLARLLRPTPRSWWGKASQALWALRIERHLTKKQILEQYLNRVPLGQGTRGVTAAASLYFNASAARLSQGQAALLAGLAREPSSDNPLASPTRAARRRALALVRMQRQGYLSADEAKTALGEPVLVTGGPRPFLAPHFTTRLLKWAEAEHRPLNGEWRTSLDLALQTALEAEVRHTVDQLRDRGGLHAAAVVLDNDTGEILAWVGSPDFWADTAGQVDMVTSPRQPGSALKPFLYGLAFDRGYTAASVLADLPRTFQTSTGPYHPRNYDRRFHGPVRAREALASSYNVPAVDMAEHIGFATLLQGLHLAGFASLDRSPEHYGLGLALGNGDVTLLEIANGYRAIANGGMWRPYRWGAAESGVESDGPERRVMSPQAAALVLHILEDVDARVPGFGVQTPFDFPFPVAAKSGTSRHFTDNWAVATTGNFTVAVWVGNFSGQPMEGVSGVTGAGPLLHRSVLATSRFFAPGRLPTPEEAGLVPVRICRVSGLRATWRCPAALEWFAPALVPSQDCEWHRDAMVSLPGEYAEWVEEQGGIRRIYGSRPPAPLGSPSPPRTIEGPSSTAVGLRIISPKDGDRYEIPPGVEERYSTVALRASGVTAGNAIVWRVDGHEFQGSRWPITHGRHVIQAESADGIDEVSILVE